MIKIEGHDPARRALVLVAIEEEAVRRFTARSLELMGFRPVAVGTFPGAMDARFGDPPPAVVIAGVGLSPGTGSSFVRAIRSRERTLGLPRIPIVLEAAGRDDDVDGTLVRPWTPEALGRLVLRAGWGRDPAPPPVLSRARAAPAGPRATLAFLARADLILRRDALARLKELGDLSSDDPRRRPFEEAVRGADADLRRRVQRGVRDGLLSETEAEVLAGTDLGAAMALTDAIRRPGQTLIL